MELETIVKDKTSKKEIRQIYVPTTNNENGAQKLERTYALFVEQYLEKPITSGDYKMAMSPTACTIKSIPVIDDF